MEEVKKYGVIKKWDDRWDIPAIVYISEKKSMCNSCNHDCSICPMRMVDPRFEEATTKQKYKDYDVATKKGICSGFEEMHPFKAAEIVSDWASAKRNSNKA